MDQKDGKDEAEVKRTAKMNKDDGKDKQWEKTMAQRMEKLNGRWGRRMGGEDDGDDNRVDDEEDE